MTLDEFEVRATLETDVGELNALYFRVSARRRSVEQWRREWLESPFGPGRSWVIRERSSGKLVGHHGILEVPLRGPNGVLRAARTENTMVDPEYRTALYYPAIEAQLLANYRGDFDALFTAAGTGAQAAMRRRLGYRPVARWIDFTPFETLGYRAGRDLGAPGVASVGWVGALRAKRPAREFEFELTRDVERVERLWRTCDVRDTVAPERSAAYLRWRLLEHPWHEFRLALLVRGGRDVGFVAWREDVARRAASKWVLEDAFTVGDDEALHHACLEHLAWRARWRGVRIYFRATNESSALARAALTVRGTSVRRAPKPASSELLVFAPKLPREWVWSVSTLIDQGI